MNLANNKEDGLIWDIKTISVDYYYVKKLKDYLADGWEPYAVDKSQHYLRKRVPAQPAPEPAYAAPVAPGYTYESLWDNNYYTASPTTTSLWTNNSNWGSAYYYPSSSSLANTKVDTGGGGF